MMRGSTYLSAFKEKSMPKISTPLVSNVIRSSAENIPSPALNKITTKNSSASMRSGEVKNLGLI